MLKFSVKTHKNFLNPEYHDQAFLQLLFLPREADLSVQRPWRLHLR